MILVGKHGGGESVQGMLVTTSKLIACSYNALQRSYPHKASTGHVHSTNTCIHLTLLCLVFLFSSILRGPRRVSSQPQLLLWALIVLFKADIFRNRYIFRNYSLVVLHTTNEKRTHKIRMIEHSVILDLIIPAFVLAPCSFCFLFVFI